jgi:hypothetical protein
MPFDLFISRAPSLSEALNPGSSQRQNPITRQEFSSVMASAPVAALMRPDGDAWLRHPQDNSPWFAARLHPKGYMVLSTSYTNHRFLRNVYDLLGAGAKMAGNLKAYLYEEMRDERVEKLDTFLEFDGQYLKLQVQVFNEAMQRMDKTCEGPLEYPIGPFDMVPCYFMFHIALTDLSPDPCLCSKKTTQSLLINTARRLQKSCCGPIGKFRFGLTMARLPSPPPHPALIA